MENTSQNPKYKFQNRKDKFKKIYNAASGVITALLFVFMVFIVVIVVVQKKNGQEIRLFGYGMYTVITESMEDTIMVGDVILTKDTENAEDLREGDIITFIAPSGQLKGYPVTHRIFSVEYNSDGSVKYFKTAGDNTYGGDSVKVDAWQLSPNQVRGVYVRTLSGMTNLYAFMSTWYGYFVVIGLPLIAVAGLFIAGFVKDRLKIEKEKAQAFAQTAKSDVKIEISDLSEEEKRKLLEEYLEKTGAKGKNSLSENAGITLAEKVKNGFKEETESKQSGETVNSGDIKAD
jgi:signal peptidase